MSENMSDYEPRLDRQEGTDPTAQRKIDSTNPARQVDVESADLS